MKPRRRTAASLALALATALAFVPAARAAEPAAAKPAPEKDDGPQFHTGKTYEDWTVGCEKAVEGKGDVCFVFQKLALKGTSRILANIAVGYAASGSAPVAILNLPLGMLLTAGVVLQVDDTEPPVRIKGPVKVCFQQGCRAEAPFGGDILEAFKRKATAHLVFMDTQERLVDLPISLKGFTKAFESLKP